MSESKWMLFTQIIVDNKIVDVNDSEWCSDKKSSFLPRINNNEENERQHFKFQAVCSSCNNNNITNTNINNNNSMNNNNVKNMNTIKSYKYLHFICRRHQTEYATKIMVYDWAIRVEKFQKLRLEPFYYEWLNR